jgi:hypothetical protein
LKHVSLYVTATEVLEMAELRGTLCVYVPWGCKYLNRFIILTQGKLNKKITEFQGLDLDERQGIFALSIDTQKQLQPDPVAYYSGSF